MRIYSMTATFGKLEQETLTLRPGLNIMEAPNEWGKSTWCAFLVAMLYGIDTRERTKQDFLADKERYAPWSGSPMSGRIDLEWNGRDITIERSTKGRGVFGQFRAYETASGVELGELTAANCGQMLLGVEKSVFTRAGFLKLTDLPVGQDESLRRRLNALVTTGDESGSGDVLAQKLKDLKNRCRSNRVNGLIPKAEAQRDALTEKLRQIGQLREQYRQMKTRQEALAGQSAKLENHRAALAYEAACEQSRKAQTAKRQLEAAARRTGELEAQCEALPTAEALMQSLSELEQLRSRREALQMEAQLLPGAPVMPEAAAAFRGCDPAQAVKQAREDAQAYRSCCADMKKPTPAVWIIGLTVMAAGIVLLALRQMGAGIALLAFGLAAAAGGLLFQSTARNKLLHLQTKAELLSERYRPLAADQWELAAAAFARSRQAYEAELEAYREKCARLNEQTEAVNKALAELTGQQSPLQCEQSWKSGLETHKAYADALREQRRMEEMVRALASEREMPPVPQAPDALTFSMEETVRRLAEADGESRRLQHDLGHIHGQIEALGMEQPLRQQLEAVNERLARLEDTYGALEIAQNTLALASAELQRKFAPRISQRAQALFGRLTDSRYDRLNLGEDLSLTVSARGENGMLPALWRSDGTVDQLYLALRLAVAEALTPDAPLVLDDALVRFDDVRLASAMEILRQYAEKKQVILFTCQSREKTAAGQK